MMQKILIPVILFILLTSESFSQSNNATLTGKVVDENGQSLELVNIALRDYPIGTSSNRRGEFLLRIPARREVTIVFSSMGFVTSERTIEAGPEERVTIEVKLFRSTTEIGEINVTENRRSRSGMDRIDPRLTNNLSAAGGSSVEALIKTLPGVSSNNELSSQFSVRGGNFDENLVYVNDIEIYRPFLIRAGQQEGLSFINSDLVSSIEFSAGGFSARYGDKMSSVLDIKYRRPTELKGSVTGSMLGGSVHVEDMALNGKLSHITGIRYKTNKYLLGSLDEKGEYDPRFVDIQTYITWKFSDKLDISFLGNIAQNRYNFIPQTRETAFGTWDVPLNTTIYFQGSEVDNFLTQLGALSLNYHPNENLNLKFIASAYVATEAETYDILGEYYLNQLERNMSSEEYGDSILNLGVGTFLNHARNYLDASVLSVSHKGAYNSENHLLNWGVKIQHESIDNQINEWIYRDSTGYSLPYSDSEVLLYYTLNSKSSLQTLRTTAYFQDTWQVPVISGDLYLNGGIRTHFWSFNRETVISPRLSINYFPEWKQDISFRFATGWYHQPAFFKELINPEGEIETNNKAQRSFQVLLGSDYIFTAWNRPFRFSSEAYYKHMTSLVPYQIDNVRIRYLPDQLAKGYAAGLDMKINGEFVSGVQSWASLSVMKTQENIEGDGHGYIPRPTDQRFNFSLYFQDYLPGNPSWKMYMSAFYGSRLPIGPPRSERWQDTFRMPPYRRVDMGISKALISQSSPGTGKVLEYIDDLSLSLEVFNLLNINNTVSYFWVTSNWGDMYAVPNYLTSRKINLKIAITF
ncbi:outer membrane receptor proteins, mostly Fe transport [Bacteroidales bacterium 6E]|nr:outer membrane receptor proteins, mostly Fe transport [Bacteroidales bacterium 6E]